MLLLVVLLLAVAAPAQAAPGLLRVVQDDATLVHGPEPARTQALDDLVALGVDVVRVNVRWRDLAPRRPADERDTRDYAGDFSPYDRLVADARARGIEVLLTLTTPAPDWAAGTLALRFPGAARPDARAFERFATAVGRRYPSGVVDRWSLINEPNNPRFLGPQSENGRPVAPALYRELARAGLRGLALAGHRGRNVLLGEVLATGRDRRGPTAPIPPNDFLREVLCLATCPGGRFEPLDAGGWAVHPYAYPGALSAPPRRTGDLNPGRLDRTRALLRLAARRGRINRRWGIWDTEDGFQSAPPSRVFAVSPFRQAALVNELEELLWRQPGVRSFAQYLVRDEPADSGFQTGWRTRAGRPKPLRGALALPLVVRRDPRRGMARAWMRLAPAGPPTATLLLPGGGRRTVRATGAGRVATVRVALRRGLYRLVHGSLRSRPARVSEAHSAR